MGNWRTEGIRRAPEIMRLRKRGKLRGALLLLGWKVIPAPDWQWTRWHAGKKHGDQNANAKSVETLCTAKQIYAGFFFRLPATKKNPMWIVANVRRDEMETPPKNNNDARRSRDFVGHFVMLVLCRPSRVDVPSSFHSISSNLQESLCTRLRQFAFFFFFFPKVS